MVTPQVLQTELKMIVSVVVVAEHYFVVWYYLGKGWREGFRLLDPKQHVFKAKWDMTNVRNTQDENTYNISCRKSLRSQSD